jgi:hypothetical protein
MVRGWSTEERRSSVKEGTREMRELRWSVVCLGSRRRRRSLLLLLACENMENIRDYLQRTVKLIGLCHFRCGVGELEVVMGRSLQQTDWRG